MSHASSSEVIAFVCPKRSTKGGTVSDPFLLTFVGALADALVKFDYQLLITIWEGDQHDWHEELIVPGRAVGIVVFGHADFPNSIERLRQKRSSFVVWGNAAIEADYCVVGSDNRQGGYLATEHLIKLGRRRIGFLGDYHAMEVDERWHGYKEALKYYGIAYDEALVAKVPHYDYATYDALYKQLVAKGVHFDGIFACTDIFANFTLRILRKINIRVPDDVSVVGFDNSSLARFTDPPLTSVSQDINFGVQALVQQLVHILNEQRAESVSVQVKLMERASSRPSKPRQGLFKLNAAGIIQYIDIGCEKLLGYQPGEIIGRHLESIISVPKDCAPFSWREFVDPDYGDQYRELKIQTKLSNCVSAKLYLVPEDGSPVDGFSSDEITAVFSVENHSAMNRSAKDDASNGRGQSANERIAELLENAAELEHLAYHDGLTEIGNRRFFEKRFAEEFSRAKHEGHEITVVMIDIDYFKRYNDSYGHIAGDKALKIVAQNLAAVFSGPDQFVARYGGEEFAAILPNVCGADGKALIGNTLKAVGACRIPHSASEVSDIVTISVGYCSVIPTQDDQLEMLLWAADQGLYEAKRNGRNQFQRGVIEMSVTRLK